MLTQTLSAKNLSLTPAAQPLLRELPADLETPISVYLKLSGSHPSFLLESVTGGEQVARYSFIGVRPNRVYVFEQDCLVVQTRQGESWQPTRHAIPDGQDPLDFLRQALATRRTTPGYGLPRFAGGLVGYMNYEWMRYFEPSVRLQAHPGLPEAVFLEADTLVAFDHAFGRLILIGNPDPDDPQRSPKAIAARLDEIESLLAGPLPPESEASEPFQADPGRANMTQAEFEQAVLAAKEHIAAGDIFQVVLSQRLQRKTSAAPFEIYRALRRLNPSPYMFYFDFSGPTGLDGLRLIGASPEMHARLEQRTASLRPIAGTRRRGKSAEEEACLEAELLADPKELAEHVMLVDLGRNDLGRICEYGTVQAPERMVIERYSHVIHLVSHVQGQLRPEYDAFDLLRATFPAGTVSGAPKIRAMQIINELEKEPRGPYAGVVGYFSYDGSMDTCIAIRTIVMNGRTAHLQAGAGIVADSQPANEYQETLNKVRALAVAIDMAEGAEALS
ncbi:MAG: anthranilate synthase component I [Chloroflexota bacterium]